MKFAVAIIFGVMSSVSVAAPETPEQVVARYHVRFAESRWLTLGEFLHPDDVARFRDQFLNLFSDENPRTRETLQELYGPGTTIKSLRVASTEEFMRPILLMLNESLDSSGIQITSQQVLGIVKEGELAHVVYRWKSTTGTMSMSQVEVRTLRPYQDSWRLLLPINLESVVPAIQRALQK